MRYIERQLREIMNDHLRTGSLESKREEVRKLVFMVSWIAENRRVKNLKSIGTKQIYMFYEFLESEGKSAATIYKYGLAARKLWEVLDFSGESPMPKCFLNDERG